MTAKHTLTNVIDSTDIDKVSQTFYDDEDNRYERENQINWIKQQIILDNHKATKAFIVFHNDHDGTDTSYSVELPVDKRIWANDKLLEGALITEANSELPDHHQNLLLKQMISKLHVYNNDGSMFDSEVFSFFRENILAQASLWFINKNDEVEYSFPLSKDEVSLLKFINKEIDNTLTGNSFIEEVLPQLWLKLNKNHGRWVNDGINDDDCNHVERKFLKIHRRRIILEHLIDRLTKLAQNTEQIESTNFVIVKRDSHD